VLVDSFAKANALNAYFSSVGTVDNGNTPDCQCFVLESVLDSIVIDASDVMWSISRLKTNSSCGPDKIPPLLFVKLKHCLCYPLAYIFNQLISVGAVPPEWKKAFITPVHKKGAAGLVQNYRPISLTCVASKIMERIVCRRILDHLYNNNILHRAQHGFLKNRSTTTNLLESLNDWTLCLQTKNQVTVVYVDFSKAFDVVSHDKLFARLHSYGIRG